MQPEENVQPEAQAKAEAQAKVKKLTYEQLEPNDTIIFSVVTQNTKHEEGIGYSLVPDEVEKEATKAFWETLPEYPANSARKGQKLDITENQKTPKLVGYKRNGKVVKF